MRDRLRLRVVLTCVLYRLLCCLVRVLARGGGERELEIVVLRHQLAILGRGGRRAQYTTADRVVLAAASRLLPPKRWSCFAVSPQTLRRWHRALLQGREQRRRRRPGRPPLAAETRGLIERLARENPRWGYMRIQGELLKLGIRVSATTVATVLRRSGLGPAPRRIGPTWSEFLRAQAQSMLGAGLPAEPGGRLGDNPCERAAPAPEGEVCRVEADELSRSGADEARRPSRPSLGLPRSAVVTLRSPRDSRSAPLRSSRQWRARDGPKGPAGRPYTGECLGRASKPSPARSRHACEAATTGRVLSSGCENLRPRRLGTTDRVQLRADS